MGIEERRKGEFGKCRGEAIHCLDVFTMSREEEHKTRGSEGKGLRKEERLWREEDRRKDRQGEV